MKAIARLFRPNRKTRVIRKLTARVRELEDEKHAYVGAAAAGIICLIDRLEQYGDPPEMHADLKTAMQKCIDEIRLEEISKLERMYASG